MTKAAHFEAKKHAYRQTQDGIVISFVVHPNDVSAEMATAPLGSRYMVAFAAIGDDEKPKQPEKPRQKWDSMKRSQQAGILCARPDFQAWVVNRYGVLGEAADFVRDYCQVDSRSKLDSNPAAAARWDGLVGHYRQATGQETERRQ